MEWVETIGKTVEEAKDRALDQLGIDLQEAEFEIVAEPSKGLFGRLRGEARVRARVAPRAPRPKQERRDRRNRDRRRGAGREHKPGGEAPADSGAAPKDGGNGRGDSKSSGGRGGQTRTKSAKPKAAASPKPSPKESQEADNGSTEPSTKPPKEAVVTVSAQEQAEIIGGFLEGLVDAFGYDASVSQHQVDEETVEVAVTGDELGLLIGPKGQTLSSVQDLARTVLQRTATGTYEGRVRIDVAGYRERRREALARFSEQMAARVLEEGAPKALEPMHPADRKVVHDTVNDIDGVHTVSEGEDRERRVVILPGDSG